MPVDPSARISPYARVDPEAVIGPQCVIQDFCVVERDVVLGRACVLEPHVFIKRWTTLGDDNEISAGTALGTDPLEKGFTADRSYLIIGHRNKIREHYTISRGTKPESTTTIGNDNYIMTSGHVAHNSTVGNHCVIASCALVAGYVEIEDQVFISGGVVVHQFSRLGRLAMIAGNTRVNMDCAPYLTFAGYNGRPVGLNLVGLRRAGFARAEISAIKQSYKILFGSGLNKDEALRRIESLDSQHANHIVSFIRKSTRPIARPAKEKSSPEMDSDEN